MGVLADFFTGTDSTAPRYTEHSGEFPDRVEAKRLTPLEVSTLWALLADREWSEDLMDEFEAVVYEDDGELMIHRFPVALVDSLAQADEEAIAKVGAAWAKTEELDWPPAEGSQLLEELATLCKTAKKDSLSVYLWNCV
jgi:hypothetical protein